MPDNRARAHRGLTIVECLVALTILGAAFLAVTYTVVAGQAHVHESDQSLRAVRLGRDLLEEIVARPYALPVGETDGGNVPPGDRAAWTIGNYHGWAEAAGEVTDLSGGLYPADEQRFGRSVSVQPASQWLADLGRSIDGVVIEVTVRDRHGRQWEFSRFVPEPIL